MRREATRTIDIPTGVALLAGIGILGPLTTLSEKACSEAITELRAGGPLETPFDVEAVTTGSWMLGTLQTTFTAWCGR